MIGEIYGKLDCHFTRRHNWIESYNKKKKFFTNGQIICICKIDEFLSRGKFLFHDKFKCEQQPSVL